MERDPGLSERIVRVEERTDRILDEVSEMRSDLTPVLVYVRTRLTLERAVISLGLTLAKVVAVGGTLFVIWQSLLH